jgi:hypothetical protein
VQKQSIFAHSATKVILCSTDFGKNLVVCILVCCSDIPSNLVANIDPQEWIRTLFQSQDRWYRRLSPIPSVRNLLEASNQLVVVGFDAQSESCVRKGVLVRANPGRTVKQQLEVRLPGEEITAKDSDPSAYQ